MMLLYCIFSFSSSSNTLAWIRVSAIGEEEGVRNIFWEKPKYFTATELCRYFNFTFWDRDGFKKCNIAITIYHSR